MSNEKSVQRRDWVHSLIDWNLIERRLKKYLAIEKHFPMKVLHNCSNKPPFYCHYMSWRLGTWSGSNDEELIAAFERQLAAASRLAGWGEEFMTFQNDCQFGTYWALLWQMQVANFFIRLGEVEWNAQGPDIKISTANGHFYVECYCPQRSYGLMEYISELFDFVDTDIRVEHEVWSLFSLPQDAKTDAFLDELFVPFYNPDFLPKKKKEAEQAWPLELPIPEGAKGLKIYLEGVDEAYQPSTNPPAGNPKGYVMDLLDKAIKAKAGKNSLDSHTPNLVAINLLLSAGYQLSNRLDIEKVIAEIECPKDINGLILSAAGIDKPLIRDDLTTNLPKCHPACEMFTSPGRGAA